MTNKEFLEAVGMEFTVARVRKKLSIPQLAKQTGLSQKCIREMEGGKSDSRILSYKRLYDALEMDMKVFL